MAPSSSFARTNMRPNIKLVMCTVFILQVFCNVIVCDTPPRVHTQPVYPVYYDEPGRLVQFNDVYQSPERYDYGTEQTKSAARTGESVPRTGERVARTGESVARTGESAARTGESAARTGESVARTGESAARTGASDRLDMTYYDYGDETPKDLYTFYEDLKIFGRKGVRQEKVDRIVGGYRVNIVEFPYHVGYGINCGGAVIDKQWVITAAHCGKKPHVTAGSARIKVGKKIPVESHYIHPGWSKSKKAHAFDYDFQLLKLGEPLTFGERVQPVKLGTEADLKVGRMITLTGWGNTVENGEFSNILRAVEVPITKMEDCQAVNVPFYKKTLTSRMFCAGFKEGGYDACQGDSGGPAVADNTILGIISFGYGCATSGIYGVFSSVASVRPWISEVTKLEL